MIKYLAAVLIYTLTLASCNSFSINTESTPVIQEYTINDIHHFIGFGHWGDDGKFYIKRVDGVIVTVYPDAEIYQQPVTEDSIDRQTE